MATQTQKNQVQMLVGAGHTAGSFRAQRPGPARMGTESLDSPVVGVPDHPPVHVAVGGERLTTHGALIGPFARVHQHVAVQGACRAE